MLVLKAMELLFASSNVNKLTEIRNLLPKGYILHTLKDLDYHAELSETTDTLEGNAIQKARFVFEKFKINCFADDSGLEVEALNGKPGVHSAYYSGLPRNNEKNIELLLSELENIENRKARFRTLIALIFEGKEILFEGTLKGTIALMPKGTNGFGYDPVFLPESSNETLAEMTSKAKNNISHRAKAVQQLITYLSDVQNGS